MMTEYIEGTYKSEDGLELYYRDYQHAGDKAPVICLPGLTRNSKDFQDIALHVTSHRRVLSLDFRGRGRSQYDPRAENYVPATSAGDTLVFMEALGLDKAVFFGTSLGGLVSMALAGVAADRVAGVILNDVGAEVDPKGVERIRGYAGLSKPVETWAEAIEQSHETNELAFPGRTDDWWERFARNIYEEDGAGKPVLDYDPAIGDMLRADSGAPDPALGWALYETLALIPTLLIRGETSDILSAETAQKMGEIKKDLSFCEVPGVGHAPALDEPVAIAAIDGFLSGL